jgi:hypothetical protein
MPRLKNLILILSFLGALIQPTSSQAYSYPFSVSLGAWTSQILMSIMNESGVPALRETRGSVQVNFAQATELKCGGAPYVCEFYASGKIIPVVDLTLVGMLQNLRFWLDPRSSQHPEKMDFKVLDIDCVQVLKPSTLNPSFDCRMTRDVPDAFTGRNAATVMEILQAAGVPWETLNDGNRVMEVVYVSCEKKLFGTRCSVDTYDWMRHPVKVGASTLMRFLRQAHLEQRDGEVKKSVEAIHLVCFEGRLDLAKGPVCKAESVTRLDSK